MRHSFAFNIWPVQRKNLIGFELGGSRLRNVVPRLRSLPPVAVCFPVAVSVPLQLTLKSESNAVTNPADSTPLKANKHKAYRAVTGFEKTIPRYTRNCSCFQVPIPFKALCHKACSGFKVCNEVRHETIPSFSAKPYNTRLTGAFEVRKNYSKFSQINELSVTDLAGISVQPVPPEGGTADRVCQPGELPDLLPWRRNGVGEVFPDSGKSGQSAADVKAEGIHPSARQHLTLILTEEQLSHLAFAVLCQISGLQDGDESDCPEVVEAIERLNEISRYCNEIIQGVSS